MADALHNRVLRVLEGGEIQEEIPAGTGVFACMLGGDDGRTLHIVANRYDDGAASDGVVLVHPVAVPHAGRP